jgi:glycosyltransferase involved in cell wall biosynthesis
MNSERLTVLHVSHTGEGGVGKCVADLVHDQVGRGWQVTVATEPASGLADAVADAGGRMTSWSATRNPTPRVPGELARLGRIIRATQPDVVHLHSSKAGLCGRLALRGRLPTLFQPHGWSFEASSGAIEGAVVAWERFAVRWAEAIVSVSQAERDRGLGKGIDGAYRVIPNGVDLARFPEADGAAQLRARGSVGMGDEPLVVCVGRLSRAKGQDVLVEAWPTVRSKVPGASLALVGDGEDLDQLRGLAGEGVLLVGHRADVADWLAASDVVAVPSRWEGMSLGMLEAMATGRSIVITDVPGAREALDGTAAIVPPEDPLALAEAITQRLLDAPLREAEGSVAAGRARESHDLRETLRLVADLTEEVARAGRRSRVHAPTTVAASRSWSGRAAASSIVRWRNADAIRTPRGRAACGATRGRRLGGAGRCPRRSPDGLRGSSGSARGGDASRS